MDKPINDISVMAVPVCEICGEEATVFVKDLFVEDNNETGTKEYSPAGTAHFFCKKHVRESEITDITESPLTRFHRKG